MTIPQLKVAVLFPFRSQADALDELSKKYEIEFIWTPYLESAELRSSRGQNLGRNVENLEEPDISKDIRTQWRDCNGVVSMDLPSQPNLLFPKLEWFQGVSAGHDHIDVSVLAEMGVTQTNSRGIASPAISEFVFARVLQELKHLRRLDKQQIEKKWEVQFGNQTEGKTLGIVGLGSIGSEIAAKAKAFGMHVVASRQNPELGVGGAPVDELVPSHDIDKMLPHCDVIVMAAPASEETEGLFNDSRFSIMKQGAIFVNIARGVHVVEADLIEHLKSGHLRAAILDVVRDEPLATDNPLWDAPNLYLSPHCSVSFDSYEINAVKLITENAIRYLAGNELINTI